MGKKDILQIVLDNPSGIFYLGQTVSGKMELQLFIDMKVSAINIIFEGFAKVRWSEGGGNNRRTYSKTENYFHNKNGSSKTDEKALCCLCCKSDPISATVMVDRTGYVPGESIVFRAEINNKSDREMTCSSAKLVMQVSYHATTKTKKVNNVLFQLKHGKIAGGGTDVWMNEKMHIPSVPPSYLQGCNIIDIRYYVTVTVDPSGAGFDLDVPLEVIIGSIPLSSIAERHGMVLPQPSASTLLQPSPGAPKGLYSATTMPTNLPQATLVESVMGRVNTTDDDDTKETTGNTDFAPVYTYYNWDKPDPQNTFTVQCQ